jgi:hypothetical protein
MHLNKFKNDFSLLLEAGFIAVNQADEDAATKLFRAAQLLDPEHTLPQIGFGYLHLHKLELKQACQVLQGVLDKEPENEMAKAFLGICMGLSPELLENGEKILEQSTHSKDPLIQTLSHTALDFIEKFVKKTPGPATPTANKETKKHKHK